MTPEAPTQDGLRLFMVSAHINRTYRFPVLAENIIRANRVAHQLPDEKIFSYEPDTVYDQFVVRQPKKKPLTRRELRRIVGAASRPSRTPRHNR
jgi:hypothetical protein